MPYYALCNVIFFHFNKNKYICYLIYKNLFIDTEFSKYSHQNDFSAMDCTDMVIGMARGTSFRILDYYTRDRSVIKIIRAYNKKKRYWLIM